MIQARDIEGRWYAAAKRDHALTFRIPDTLWTPLHQIADAEHTSCALLISDQIEAYYIDYATRGALPCISITAKQLYDLPEHSQNHHFIRVNMAVRSMAAELAEAQGEKISEIVRLCIAAIIFDPSRARATCTCGCGGSSSAE